MPENKGVITPYFKYKDKAVSTTIKKFQLIRHAGAEIYYAMKANSYKKLLNAIKKNGFGLDVASEEEIKLGLSLGFSGSQMVYAAPAKKISNIEFAKESGITTLMADTLYGVEAISEVYQNAPHDIVLRVEGHGANATFNLSDKFGLTADEASNIIKLAKEKRYHVSGVTLHVGSQNLDLDAWDHALQRLERLVTQFQVCDLPLKIIDLGGGIPARYSQDTVLKEDIYIAEIARVVRMLKSKYSNTKIAIEPGRAIAAPAFELFTSIVDIKSYKSIPVVIVDTSVFMGLIEAVYGVNYPIELVRASESSKTNFIVGGITCDGCDIVYNEVNLPADLRIGDVLKISLAGAYTAAWERVHLLPWPEIV